MASTTTALNILVTAQTAAAKAQLASVDAQMKKMAATSGATGASMGKMNKGLLAGASGAAALAGALAIAGKQLYDVGKELDDAYDTIRAGTGATGKELAKLKRDFRSVARTVPDDFKTTGIAIADLNTRLGLTDRPLRRMSRNMLNLSRITETDLEANIKSVARAFVDWEVPVRDQTKALNGLYRLGQKSGATVSEIADNMQKFGSPLRTLGWEMEEAAAMFANFERAGVNMQTMVPGLKLAIGNLADPTDELAGNLQRLGVAVGKPEEGLRQIMALLGNNGTLSNVQKMNLAMDVFGKRAGADMAEAIRQGRFNLESFIKEFRDGGDTIQKTTKQTNDAAQNMAIVWNKVKIAVAPAADAIYEFAGRVTAWLAGPSGNKAFRTFGKIVTTTFRGIVQVFKPFVVVMRAGFDAISASIRGTNEFFRNDVVKTWQRVRELFSNGIKAIKSLVGGLWGGIKGGVASVRDGMTNAFTSMWSRVRKIFVSGANAAISVVNGIIDAINLIPGVPDIGKVGKVGGGSGAAGKLGLNLFQRGGVLTGGDPSGDSIPALLERGEYVLNRQAVQKVGVEKLNALNFKAAPRFQQGGPIGMIGGGAVDAVKNVVGKVADTAMKGPGFFLDKLPDPEIPQPFTGVGPYLIKKVSEWIKSKIPTILGGGGGGSFGGGSGTYPGVSGDTDFTPALGNALSKMAKASGQSIYVQSGWRSYAEQAALYEAYLNGTGNLAAPPGSSNHESGRAADITPGSEVFGGMAGRFGLGFTVPGESWHIELLRRGGLVGALRKLQKGGSAWKKTGYTVYNDPPPGSFGSLTNGYAELGTATTAGLTGYGYLAQLFGRKGELPENFPLDVKINGKIKRLKKRDRGWGQGSNSHGIDIWQDSWPFFGLNSNSSGNAFVRIAGSGGKGKGGKSGPKKVKQPSSGGVRPDANWGGEPHEGPTALDKQREAEKKRREKKRKRMLNAISAKGIKFPLFGSLKSNTGNIAKLNEKIGLVEQMAGTEQSPDGSDLSQSEVEEQISYYQKLMEAQRKRFWILVKSIAHIRKMREHFAVMIEQARKPGSKLRWKLGAFREAFRNTGSTLSDLNSDKIDLVGVTGQGGAMFDTRMKLQELGATVRGGPASQIAGFSIDDILRISEATKYNVFDALPRAHTGANIVGPKGAEVPVMVQAGETITPAGGDGVVVNLHFADGMDWLKDFVSVEIEQAERRNHQTIRAGMR